MDHSKTFLQYVKLVQYMRTTQRKYFDARKRNDMAMAKQLLHKSFELERRVDEVGVTLIELFQTGFQPELFK